MRLAIAIMMISSLALADGTYHEFGETYSYGGQWYSLLTSDVPSGGQTDYLWDTDYVNSVLLFDMTNAATIIYDNSFLASNNGTNQPGGAASAFIDKTNGVSSYRYFDGTADYIVVPDDASLTMGNGVSNYAFTVSFWYKPETDTFGYLIAKIKDIASTVVTEFYIDYRVGGDIGFVHRDFASLGSKWVITDDEPVTVGVWNHIYITSASGIGAVQKKIYVNGVEASAPSGQSGIFVAINDTSTDLGIMSPEDGVGGFGNGSLDGLNIKKGFEGNAASATNEFVSTRWNNPDNIYNGDLINPGKGWTQNMNANKDTALYKDATHWYSFNPEFGNNNLVADQSLNENHGTASLSGNRFTISSLGGTTNGKVVFNNANAHIDCGDLAGYDTGTNDFAIAIWFNILTDGATYRLVSKDDGSNRQLLLQLEYITTDTWNIRFGYWPSGTAVFLDDTFSYTTGTWYHAVCQRVGNSFEIWKNGTLSASGTTSGSHGSMIAANEPVFIGMTGSSSLDFKGYVDEFIHYPMSLSSNQVNTLYGNGEGWK